MKTTILTALLFITLSASAQIARKDSTGNYTVINKAQDSTSTGKFITDKDGIKYPVYANVNGKLFYLRAGRRRYFKLENQ